ncbi:hypothetical protein Tco_0150830 [Tanacetum coccineum]
MTRIDDLEKQLKETKQTFGKAILTLVERVKTLEVALKRKTKRVLLSDSEEEDTEAQGRKGGTSKTKPTTLEAAAILTKVHKIKSVDKGKRYKRRKSSKEFPGAGLDFEEVKSGIEKVNTSGIKVSSGIEEINAASLIVNTGIDPRAKLEANAELKESVLGKDLTVEDYAKKMVEDMEVDSIEEVKAEFEKLVKQLDTFVPMNFEATKESLKKFGEELQTKTAKKLKFDDEGTKPTEEKIEEDKDDKPTKKTGKRRKQIEGKDSVVLKFPLITVPVAQKSPVIANYKIIKQEECVYQHVREKEMIGKALEMLNDISRDDLTELYMIVMKKHAMLTRKLQGGKPDEDCYKLLKMMEKQAGAKGLTSPEQMATGAQIEELKNLSSQVKIKIGADGGIIYCKALIRTRLKNAFNSEFKEPAPIVESKEVDAETRDKFRINLQALNVDSLKVDLVVIQNTYSEKEDSNSETASSKSVKKSSLDFATKDVHEIKYKISKAKERCMASKIVQEKDFNRYPINDASSSSISGKGYISLAHTLLRLE